MYWGYPLFVSLLLCPSLSLAVCQCLRTTVRERVGMETSCRELLCCLCGSFLGCLFLSCGRCGEAEVVDAVLHEDVVPLHELLDV